MLRTPKKPTKKAAPKLVAVIKNGHTDAELDEMEERWVNHKGPYMTLAQTLAHAAERDKRIEETAKPIDAPLAAKTVNVVQEIIIGKDLEFTDLMRESKDKTGRDVYNDDDTRSKRSDTSNERTSDRERHHQ